VLDPRPARVRYVVDLFELVWVLLRVLRLYSVIVIPPMLHTHRHTHVAFTRKTNWTGLGTFQKSVRFLKLAVI
jgi:hypothetical protein